MSDNVKVMASAKVGRSGTARHIVQFTIWIYPDRYSISDGTVICGARRMGSGSHSFTLDPEDANCERCLNNWYIMKRAEEFPEASTIVEFKHGRLSVKEGAL